MDNTLRVQMNLSLKSDGIVCSVLKKCWQTAVGAWKLGRLECHARAVVLLCVVTFVQSVRPANGETDISRNALERRINSFRVQNGSMGVIADALSASGVRLCWEASLEPADVIHVDSEGNEVFTGRAYSVASRDVCVRDLLNEIVKAAPDYKWESIAGSDLINLVPRDKSCLSFSVRAFKAHGEIVELCFAAPELKKLPPIHWRGQEPERIELNFRGGSARDALNAIVGGYPSYVWRCVGSKVASRTSLSFSEVTPEPGAIVDLVYDVAPGKPIRNPLDLRVAFYTMAQERADGGPRLVVVRKAIDLVYQRTARLAEPDRALVREFVAIVRLILAEDEAEIVAHYHPDGVMDGKQKYSRDEFQAILKCHWAL